jgi:hypothetical protein
MNDDFDSLNKWFIASKLILNSGKKEKKKKNS